MTADPADAALGSKTTTAATRSEQGGPGSDHTGVVAARPAVAPADLPSSHIRPEVGGGCPDVTVLASSAGLLRSAPAVGMSVF
jgi:hypothetical protein